MARRLLALIGCRIAVQSSPESGTVVEITVPATTVIRSMIDRIAVRIPPKSSVALNTLGTDGSFFSVRATRVERRGSGDRCRCRRTQVRQSRRSDSKPHCICRGCCAPPMTVLPSCQIPCPRNHQSACRTSWSRPAACRHSLRHRFSGRNVAAKASIAGCRSIRWRI